MFLRKITNNTCEMESIELQNDDVAMKHKRRYNNHTKAKRNRNSCSICTIVFIILGNEIKYSCGFSLPFSCYQPYGCIVRHYQYQSNPIRHSATQKSKDASLLSRSMQRYKHSSLSLSVKAIVDEAITSILGWTNSITRPFVYTTTTVLNTPTLPTIDLSKVLVCFQIVIITLMVPIVIGIFQGGLAIYNYKTNFGDAPPPKVPAHGVVIATLSSTNNSHTNTDVVSNNSTIWTNSRIVGKDDFIRLLLIGDSLAVGIGQFASCTPIMPESIAKVISSNTGKAVYWTCVGESGASTSWIVQMLQNSTQIQQEEHVYQPPDFENWEGKKYQFPGNYYTNGSDAYAVEGIWSRQQQQQQQNSSRDSNENNEWKGRNELIKVWKERLLSYRSNFDPAAMGPYDVVVIVTGSNDLKTLLFPFMLDDDDENSKQSTTQRKKKPGVVENLNLLMQTINEKVDIRLQRTLQSIQEASDNMITIISEQSESIYRTFGLLLSNETITESKERYAILPMESISNRADEMYEDIRTRIEKLSTTFQIVTSKNYTLSEKVNSINFLSSSSRQRQQHHHQQQQQPSSFVKLKERTVNVTDDMILAATTTFQKLRSAYNELQLLLELSTDYSQMYIHPDDFADPNPKPTIPTTTEPPPVLPIVASTGDNNSTSSNEIVRTTTVSVAAADASSRSNILTQPNVVAGSTTRSSSSPGKTTILDDVIIRPTTPLFVLPAMPSRALPIFRHIPIRWLAVPVFDWMDYKKKQFAQSNSLDILFVNDPSVHEIIEYENGYGTIQNEINNEMVLLSIKDIRQEDCMLIEQSMQNYFRTKKGFHSQPLIGSSVLDNDDNDHSSEKVLSGTRIFSPDRIHPNDYGYNFWGRHIGKAIVQQLKVTEKGSGHEK